MIADCGFKGGRQRRGRERLRPTSGGGQMCRVRDSFEASEGGYPGPENQRLGEIGIASRNPNSALQSPEFSSEQLGVRPRALWSFAF